MSILPISRNVDRILSDKSVKTGFRPELYTVAAGSYISNPSHGALSESVNSYVNIQIPRGTSSIASSTGGLVNSTEGCEITRKDGKVNFTCSIMLNAQTDPAYGTEELRIKPRFFGFDQPARYMVGLPVPSQGTNKLPFFSDFEILDKDSVVIAPDLGTGAGVWELRAVLLNDRTLALVLYNQATGNTQPLTHNNIDAAFGVADSAIFINIRGEYKI
jgi:hypothetical protein